MRNNAIKNDIVIELGNDTMFDFKRVEKRFERGICPNCGERSCYVSVDNPYQVMCNHQNNCGWKESTQKLYPHIFGNISERYHPTPEDPNAPATAYLIYNRGFAAEQIKGFYTYKHERCYDDDGSGHYKDCPAVAFTLENSGYQARLIDTADVKRFGKTRASPYKGFGWVPPKMELKKGDVIFITEAIFKSMAFLAIEKKSITGLNASCIPEEFIKEHAKKNVKWVVAMDNDKAGLEGAAKAVQWIKDIGGRVYGCLPKPNEDWDDVFRARRLNDDYINASLLRWREFVAKNSKEKAFFKYLQTGLSLDVFPFKNKIYRYKFELKEAEDAAILRGVDCLAQTTVDTGFELFLKQCEISMICEGEIEHVFTAENLEKKSGDFPVNHYNVSFYKNGNPTSSLIYGDGTMYLSAKNFNEILMKQTGGAVHFRGGSDDVLRLRDVLLAQHAPTVKKVNFQGYLEPYDCYVFPAFLYHNGKKIEVNDYGFATLDKHAFTYNIRQGLITIIDKPDPFNSAWITPYFNCFGMHGMITLSWWIGTLFAEQIRGFNGFWPFLESVGLPGTGKTTAIKFLWKALGAQGELQGFDPNKTTDAGLPRQLAQISNMPAILLEADGSAKNTDQEFNFNFYKEMYDKGGILRSVAIAGGSNDTEVLRFKAGLAIVQNTEIVSKNELYERLVSCKYETTFFPREAVREVDKLKLLTEKDLGGFLHHILSQETFILTEYKKAFVRYDELFDAYEDRENLCPSLRIRRNHAQLAAITSLLPALFSGLITDRDVESIVAELWERAKKQFTRCQGDSPILEQFWDSFDHLCNSTNVTSSMYGKSTPIRLDHSKNPDLIAISLPEVQQAAELMKVNLPLSTLLIKEFKRSTERKLVGRKGVDSSITGGTKNCWVFERKKSKK